MKKVILNVLALFTTVANFGKLLLGVACLLLLQSCYENNNNSHQIFHYNQSSGISSLDPAFARDQATIWATNQLFNGLVQLDSNLNIVPAIAHHYSISANGLVYTFQLHTDVFFHKDACFSQKSRVVTAADFVYSLMRISDKKTASPGAWIFNGKLDSVAPFTALNDSTFQLKLRQPFPPMLGILTMQYCSVVPREAIEKYGTDFRSHPVGTGPFQFKIWKEGVALILTKNPHYFEFDNGQRLPKIEGVRISFINNKKTEFLTFRKGELDLVSGIDASFIDEVLDDNGALKPTLKNEFNLTKVPYLNTEYLGFNTQDKGIVGNKKIRQAINYSFDRKELIRYLRNGVGRPALQGFTPCGLPSFDSTLVGYSYQPERAKLLLRQAGYPDGRGLPIIQLFTNETYKEMGLFVAKQAEKIGFRIQLEINQGAVLREWMSQGKAPFFRASWIADYPDAENYFTVFYSKNGAPPNYTRFQDERYDALYEKVLQETEFEKRTYLYRQLEEIILEEAPIVPLYYDEVLRFTGKRVHGLSPNGLNLLDLRKIWLQEPLP